MSASDSLDVLGPLERDAVAEMLNVAVGRAAAALSQLVAGEILLSVPEVAFLSPPGAARHLDQATGPRQAVAVRQSFQADFSGHILLIFPEEGSLNLVRGMLGSDASLEGLGELEQEALLEVGNIVLNACLGSLANQLGIGIESSMPAYLRGRGSDILQSGMDDAELVMVLQVDFSVAANGLAGYLAFAMDVGSARAFTDAVTAYVARRLGPGHGS